MIKEKQKDIINKMNNSDKIIRFKELEKQIKNNKEYNSLMDKFNSIDSPSNEDIIELRKELFKIDGVKEYLSLENDIRLLSIKINSIITSIVDTDSCK